MDEKTVLVADDDHIILDVVRFRLERDGYRVITAEDGVEALDRVREERPDLCILDVMMPKKSGVEVLAEMRADAELSKIPVILLTARAQDADLDRGFDAGADDYVVKPFSPQELHQRVRRQIGA